MDGYVSLVVILSRSTECLNAEVLVYLRFIGPMIAPAERRSRTAAKMVGPLIQERLDMDPSQWPVSSQRLVLILAACCL